MTIRRPFALGTTSLNRLKGVDPRMVEIVKLAITLTDVDFMVVEGFRTKERQRVLYNQGRTTDGPKVTWTMNSKHCQGLAVDLVPWVNGKIDWTAGKNFDEINRAMTQAAHQLGFNIRWGADWDSDGKPREKGETDSPHFEMAAGKLTKLQLEAYLKKGVS